VTKVFVARVLQPSIAYPVLWSVNGLVFKSNAAKTVHVLRMVRDYILSVDQKIDHVLLFEWCTVVCGRNRIFSDE
jgi:hypothetical protein